MFFKNEENVKKVTQTLVWSRRKAQDGMKKSQEKRSSRRTLTCCAVILEGDKAVEL